MPEANIKEVSVSLDASDNRVKMIFEHLPRVGDHILYDDNTYTVVRIVFNAIESSLGIFGYPNIYCEPANRGNHERR